MRASIEGALFPSLCSMATAIMIGVAYALETASGRPTYMAQVGHSSLAYYSRSHVDGRARSASSFTPSYLRFTCTPCSSTSKNAFRISQLLKIRRTTMASGVSSSFRKRSRKRRVKKARRSALARRSTLASKRTSSSLLVLSYFRDWRADPFWLD
jgi:hypothetical protein